VSRLTQSRIHDAYRLTRDARGAYLSFLEGVNTGVLTPHLNRGRDALPRVQADQQVGPTGFKL